MRRLALALVVVSTAFSPASWITATGQEQESPAEVSAAFAEGGDLWFVELTGAPAADGGSLTQLRNEKAAFRRAAAQAGISFQERRAFDVLWNGLSIRVDPAQVSRLTRLDGVRAVYPVVSVAIPEPADESGPELSTALSLTGVDVAQSELGLTGEGIRVAVMDTGVDYHHPDLGGCFGPGCRVVAGYDFVGNAFSGGSSTPAPDADPDDCNGHGTHVAGIVGADGTVKGVAPGVTFGAYKVFGCSGSTTADIMIAAMERALSDRMDVLNMSIGAAFQWPQYPTAQASDRLVNRGMVVVASAGNSGGNGLFSMSAPSLGSKVISVASFNNTHANLAAFTVSPDDRPVGYTNATAARPAPLSGSLSLAKSGTPASGADACNVSGASPFTPGQFAGQAVLIRRGACSFHEKSVNAQNAGAAAVVLYNNVAGRVSPTVAGPTAITIPVVAITAADGAVIDERIAGGATHLTWTGTSISESLGASAGVASSFSSYGLSPDLTLKPDLGAPGGQIRSTYPLENGGYATISGTSMSSPHVAGAVALLLQARPSTPAQAVRKILQNTADPRPWWGNPGLGFLDNVHRQGAGMLDIDQAIVATGDVEPSKLSLGESEAGPVTARLTVRNHSPADVTYQLGHTAALATGPNTFAMPSFFSSGAAVTFSQPSLRVPAGGTASIDVTITAPAGLADRGQYGGYIEFARDGGAVEYRVPYAGLKGDYQSIPVLEPTLTAFGFPWLARLTGTTFFSQPGGASYAMGADIPYILVHLDHQVRRLRLNVRDAATGRSWHRALDLDYVGRNGARAPNAGNVSFFFALPWDGTVQVGNRLMPVPNGTYEVTVEVLKALGREDNPAHVETWTSPVITIARPPSSTP